MITYANASLRFFIKIGFVQLVFAPGIRIVT